MGQAELKIFIVLATLILFVFIGGMIIFIIQYHRKKLAYEKDKAIMNEQYLQDLLNTKLEIQQHTMQDIGREIHDNVGQRLILASLYANKIVFGKYDDEVKTQVTEVVGIINESLADLRAISKNLTNSGADYSELREVIEQECHRVAALNLCAVNFTSTDTNFRMSGTVKNFILRIVQEFLQNSLKHASCKHISLDFVYGEKGLHITARDDGRGFDMGQYNEFAGKGIGLTNMRKRAALIEAEFSFTSIPHKGTSINLFIPVEKINV